MTRAENETTSPGGVHFLVEITVDGKPVPLKPFLHDLVGGAVSGLLRGLRDVNPAPQELSVQVRRLGP